MLTIIENLFNEKKISYNKVLLLSLFTAFLISIRTLGLIIFLQYLISLIILFNVKKINFFEFIEKNFKVLIVYILSTLLLIYLLEILSVILCYLLYYCMVCFIFRHKPHNPMLNSGAIITSSLLLKGPSCCLSVVDGYIVVG